MANDSETARRDGGERFAMERTCAECPWRKDVPVGRFSPERYEALAKTCEQDFANPIFACHKTPPGREVACAGFLLVAGWENIRVRLAAARGAFDMAKITAAAPLYESFEAMARANGWRPAPHATGRETGVKR